MKRFAFLAGVACLCGCALSGTGRADLITYDVYSGGVHGTKLAEYQVSSFIDKNTFLDPLHPDVPHLWAK
jgi:hypothetical protein